eukprot:1161844-Pelagomonas_calceolata.AAC.1
MEPYLPAPPGAYEFENVTSPAISDGYPGKPLGWQPPGPLSPHATAQPSVEGQPNLEGDGWPSCSGQWYDEYLSAREQYDSERQLEPGREHFPDSGWETFLLILYCCCPPLWLLEPCITFAFTGKMGCWGCCGRRAYGVRGGGGGGGDGGGGDGNGGGGGDGGGD